MATPYPILISVPHGGTLTPPELADRVVLSVADLFDDIDPLTREIYACADLVTRWQGAEVARTFVDLNRRRDDLDNPDGVIKKTTCFGVPIYATEPDPTLIEKLLVRYYDSYHEALARHAGDERVAVLVDCHSMLAVGPRISPDTGKPRPMICLGDRNGTTCPPELTDALADSLRRAFGLGDDQVVCNQPFSGGHITRHYAGNPKPSLQIELNRALYLAAPWFEPETRRVSPTRIAELAGMFGSGLADWAESKVFRSVLDR